MGMRTEKHEEIHQEALRLNQEIKRLENQIEMLRLQKKHLQATCDHPLKYEYSSMGDVGSYCPDCEWQT